MRATSWRSLREWSVLGRKRLAAQSARFAIVGVAATAIHSICYVTALRWLSPEVANAFGFACAVSVSYCGNRFWTFPGGRAGAAAIWRFAVAATAGFVCNAAIVHFVSTSRGWRPYWAVVGIAFVTPVLTFILLRLWVFAVAEPRRGAPNRGATD